LSGWRLFFFFFLPGVLLVHAEKQKLVSLLDSLCLNASYSDGEAKEEHRSNHGKHEGKVR